jgi:hypothetical protein
MIRRIRPRHALVVTCLALSVLAGAAYAVAASSPPAGPSEVVAFANVRENGIFILASGNLPQSAVTRTEPGVYCFTDLPFTAPERRRKRGKTASGTTTRSPRS